MADPAIRATLKVDHLSEETRRVYIKNLAKIAEAAGNRALLQVLIKHADKVIQYVTTKYTEVASQKTMLVSIMAMYKLLDLKAKSQASYDWYLELFDNLDGKLRERSKTNLPSLSQAAGFVSHANSDHNICLHTNTHNDHSVHNTTVTNNTFNTHLQSGASQHPSVWLDTHCLHIPRTDCTHVKR